MANTDLIIPIVVAAVGLVGTVISLIMSWLSEKRVKTLEFQLQQQQVVANLREKYSQPLLVAAYDLQQRLFDLVEYPISRQHLTKPDGLVDLKKFTCYLLAQYLAYTYILRTKTSYLSFSKDDKLEKMRGLMYKIDEELDRRRDKARWNVGVWPAARILVCERMIIREGITLNEALDGGFGVEVKTFDTFQKEWTVNFQEPMEYFCEWIDLMLEGRVEKKDYLDAPMRCLQHLLVDLVKFLDENEAYIAKDHQTMKCARSAVWCDCDKKGCQEGGSFEDSLKSRQESRRNDAGLWAFNGLKMDGRRERSGYDPKMEKPPRLDLVKELTLYVDLV